MSPVYPPVIAEQSRLRHDHHASRQRHQSLRRAHQRCEDLTELLGRLTAAQNPCRAEVHSKARAVARELHRLVAGPVPVPPLRQRRGVLTAVALDQLVEELDEVLCDLRAGFCVSQRAVDLAGVIAAGVEALTSSAGD